MPRPGKAENESKFISRCIPFLINDGTAQDNKQAAAICYSIWAKRNEKKAFVWGSATHPITLILPFFID